MKKNKLHNQAFTLVEILVSMTIFTMVLVSVIMIYATVSEISAKYNINREMRQNIKSVVEDISEEVRKNSIKGVKSDYLGDYNFINESGDRIKVGDIEYYLVLVENIDEISPLIASSSDCNDLKNICVLYKKGFGPLSNSKISFTNLVFSVSGENEIPKVTLTFTARAGIRAELAEKSKIIFQTTFSERVLKIK